MKKTVIKRRKRVPAAGAVAGEGGVNAMSDQAAAEALVAVGRSRVSAASSPHPNNHPHPTDDDAEDAPRRKRARRKAPPAAAAAEEERERERQREQERERERNKRPWFPGADHQGPFDLPPLQRAFPPFPTGAGPGAGAGYMRSASAGSGSVPSRGGAGSPAAGVSAGQYTLPPVRSGSYYPGVHDGASNGINGSASVGSGLVNGDVSRNVSVLGLPTLEELERHYFHLHENRRKTEELLRDTERIMQGVKRGLDELRAGIEAGNVPSGNGGASAPGSGAPEMVPLRERERGRSREGAGPSVWPVNNEAPRE